MLGAGVFLCRVIHRRKKGLAACGYDERRSRSCGWGGGERRGGAGREGVAALQLHAAAAASSSVMTGMTDVTNTLV